MKREREREGGGEREPVFNTNHELYKKVLIGLHNFVRNSHIHSNNFD